jgi:hypothetical protein
MAQEIQTNLISLFSTVSSSFSFGAMRDNGDDAFGTPLDRSDRPVHVPVVIPSSSSTTTSSSTVAAYVSSLGSSSLSTSTPLDLFIQAVHQALNSGLSKQTLIANIHLISDERTESSQPTCSDDFFSQ